MELLLMTGVEATPAAAAKRIEAALKSGRAAEIFGRMIAALGGPADFVERPDRYLPKSKYAAAIYASNEGYLASVDARRVGMAIIGLGGGRARMDDKLDLSTGFVDMVPTGEWIESGRPLAVAHAATEGSLARAIDDYRKACTVSPSPPKPRPLIYD
jgi:thymidine phosphorylase